MTSGTIKICQIKTNNNKYKSQCLVNHKKEASRILKIFFKKSNKKSVKLIQKNTLTEIFKK